MIENIHDYEGKEKRHTGRINNNFKVPKNIKQVGECTSSRKIYLEDYVFTYIKELVSKEYMECKIAVLLGNYKDENDTKIIMINGAIQARLANYESEEVFTNDVWTDIYEYIRKYFNQVEIVGWFIGGPGFSMENEDKLKKIYIDNFAGKDKTLLKYDSMEEEEGFYFYENGTLTKQSGYYVYYEKNEAMQSYLYDTVETRRKKTEESNREKISHTLEEKKISDEEVGHGNKSTMRLLYVASGFMVVMVLAAVGILLHNNERIDSLQTALNELSQTVYISGDRTAIGEVSGKEDTMDVETISGSLSSVHLEKVVGDRSETVINEEGKKEGSDQEKEKSDEGGQENTTEEHSSVDGQQSSGETNQDNNIEKGENKKESNGNDSTGNTSSTQSTEPVIVTSSDGTRYYIVQKGDTLASISYKLFQSRDYVNKIAELNGIEDQDMIYYGLKLIIP